MCGISKNTVRGTDAKGRARTNNLVFSSDWPLDGRYCAKAVDSSVATGAAAVATAAVATAATAIVVAAIATTAAVEAAATASAAVAAAAVAAAVAAKATTAATKATLLPRGTTGGSAVGASHLHGLHAPIVASLCGHVVNHIHRRPTHTYLGNVLNFLALGERAETL